MALFSDDFSASALDAGWTFVDPVGDCSASLVGFGTADAHARISVAGGGSHDAWTDGLEAPHLTQTISNVDFSIAVKLQTAPTNNSQLIGIHAKEDADNFVRFGFYYGGSGLKIFCATVYGVGPPGIRVNDSASFSAGELLRLTRSTHDWTAERSSDDGDTWSTVATFTRGYTIASVGIHAGNAGSNPAFDAEFDYFFDVDNPISPEDPVGAEISIPGASIGLSVATPALTTPSDLVISGVATGLLISTPTLNNYTPTLGLGSAELSAPTGSAAFTAAIGSAEIL